MKFTGKNNNKEKQKFKVKSWYSNRYQIVVVQRNILLVFATLALFSMSIAILFVKFAVSSKTFEPYVIEIEQKTGIATVVDQMTTKDFTGNEIIKRYFLNQFIQSAVAYNSRTYKGDVEKIRLFSTPSVYEKFRSSINPRELGSDSSISIRIKSIQFPDQSTAQLRILQEFNTRGKETEKKDKLLTINFFFNQSITLSMEERLTNPLGFQVTNYNLIDEIFTDYDTNQPQGNNQNNVQ